VRGGLIVILGPYSIVYPSTDANRAVLAGDSSTQAATNSTNGRKSRYGEEMMADPTKKGSGIAQDGSPIKLPKTKDLSGGSPVKVPVKPTTTGSKKEK
jgi:hypothetical protein